MHSRAERRGFGLTGNVNQDFYWYLPAKSGSEEEEEIDLAKVIIVSGAVLVVGLAMIGGAFWAWRETPNDELYYAAGEGDVNLARKALADGAEIDAPNELSHQSTPLIAAAGNGHKEMVEFLLSKGANPLRTNGDISAWAVAGKGEIRDLIQEAIDRTRQKATGGSPNPTN